MWARGGNARELDPHERVSAAHARLAALHAEISEIHQELSQEQLAAGAGSALMLPVPEATETRPLLSVPDVAKLLHVDAKTIRNWGKQGLLPAAVKIGGVIRWNATDIDHWLAEKREAVR